VEPKDVLEEIKTIRSVLFDSHYQILHDESVATLASLEAQIHRQKSRPNWKLVIPVERPIRFREAKKKHHFLRLDLFGCLEQEIDAGPKLKVRITLRAWSSDEDLYHRDGLDCVRTKLRINPERGRVLTRFHFDSAEPDAFEPRYHFHVGGRYREDDEHCWYPEWLNVPRFSYHPMNLILACEFVVANFFPEVFREIACEATWRDALALAQREYVFPHFDFIARLKTTEESLLQHLCQS